MMRVRQYELDSENLLRFSGENLPERPSEENGSVRWVEVDLDEFGEVAEIFARLGLGDDLFATWRNSEHDLRWIVQTEVLAFNLPLPASLQRMQESQVRVLCIPGVMVTFRAYAKDRSGDDSVILDPEAPLIDRTVPAMVLRLLEYLGDEDVRSFYELRTRVEEYSDRLPREATEFDINAVETASRRLSGLISNCFDYQHTLMGLPFLKLKCFQINGEDHHYQRGKAALEHVGKGLEQLQGRLQRLHDQYRLDMQTQTDNRLRTLTVLSAIFLPLTLIAGVYGMNFQYMPELDDRYSYFIVLGIMVLIGAVMMLFFRLKGWFK